MDGKPNTTIIELSSINKLSDALLRAERVEPDIRSNDKTPSWDGELRVYYSQAFDKANLYGRIPVQIKGQWVEKIHGNTIKFTIDADDINNYLNDNGAMFFAIQLNTIDSFKIYYCSLLPFDLRRIQDEMQPGQKTKQITLQHFPDRHKKDMLFILYSFIDNRKKQGTLLPDVRSMQDLTATNLEIETFEFSVPRLGATSTDEMLDNILKTPLYMYVKPKNIDASFAVDKISPEEIFTQKQIPITVNDELLYQKLTIGRTIKGKKEIKIGSGITIEIGDKRLHFNFSFTGSLNEQIKELTLLLALARGEDVRIGHYTTKDGKFNLDGHTIEEVEDRLIRLKEVSAALLKLHVEKDLELATLSEKEFKLLNWLVSGIDGKPVPICVQEKSGSGVLTIGNIKILLICKHNEVGEGFLISDFFSSPDWRFGESGKPFEDSVPISPYVLMDCEDLQSIDNIDFDNIVNSIRKFPYSAIYGEKAVLFVLELLKYYDLSFPKEMTTLEIANGILDFLSENNRDGENLYQINRFQIIKRQRPLNYDEVQYLVLIKDSGISPQFQLATNILLESFQEATLIYSKLSKTEQQVFDEFPITHLWPGHGISSKKA